MNQRKWCGFCIISVVLRYGNGIVYPQQSPYGKVYFVYESKRNWHNVLIPSVVLSDSLSKYLFSTNYVPSTVLVARNNSENVDLYPCS